MKYDNIKDDEIRIIKKKEANEPLVRYSYASALPKAESDDRFESQLRRMERCRSRTWGRALALLLCGGVLALIGWLWYKSGADDDNVISAFEPELVEYSQDDASEMAVEDKTPLSVCGDSIKIPYVEVIEKEVNDIPLTIYIPHNATPRLKMGLPSPSDEGLVFTTQAADVRADNGKIVGAFVIDGEPLSWGLSKKGYCAIIDGKVTVGMADNSPLFEQATEKGGYFFRQYALVSDGKLVENNLRNKSLRKAMCVRGKEVFVAMTTTRESMHDFSQALVDLGVDNAIYIVGSYSFSMYRDSEGVLHQISGQLSRMRQINVNFIEWR